jgi:RNA polymerase sigma-70 factor (ECF subfamily)
VRAKARVKSTGIAFELPDRAEWADRLGSVLEAVYATAALAGGDRYLEEGMYLAGLLADELPREAEVRGLNALMQFLSARRSAGRGADGKYVPLPEQDPSQWDHRAIDRGEGELRAAAALGRAGRFQLEAAIHSAHCWRRTGGETPWTAILAMHDRLAALAPTLGSEVARASVIGEVHGPAAALAALEALAVPPGMLAFEAARAHWLARAGRTGEARAAYGRAALQARDPAVRDWLEARRTAPAG